MPIRLISLLFLAVAFVSASGSARADFAGGEAAYRKGDYAKAVREWREAAEKGDVNAQFNLGQMYRQGLGVAKDMSKAFKWYKRAADQGMPRAQGNVGFMLARGIGTKRDDIEAYKWFTIAAAQGDGRSKRTLDFLARRMEQDMGKAEAHKAIGEAKFRAAIWQPKPEKGGG